MFQPAEEIKHYVDGIIHEETQLAETGIDLTVNRITTPASPADLDFGGGEENQGDLEVIEPANRSSGDDYGWWNLEAGIYIISFNEDIDVADSLGVIGPLERLTSGGSVHSPLVFTGHLERKPVVYVPEPGLNIKENARISRLMIWI